MIENYPLQINNAEEGLSYSHPKLAKVNTLTFMAHSGLLGDSLSLLRKARLVHFFYAN